MRYSIEFISLHFMQWTLLGPKLHTYFCTDIYLLNKLLLAVQIFSHHASQQEAGVE